MFYTPIGSPNDFAALAMPANFAEAYRQAERIFAPNGVTKTMMSALYEMLKANTPV